MSNEKQHPLSNSQRKKRAAEEFNRKRSEKTIVQRVLRRTQASYDQLKTSAILAVHNISGNKNKPKQ